jgi:hypothetical protein
LAAPTVLLIARRSGRAASLLAMIFAAAAIVTGTANALEDAIGVRELGSVYVVGVLVAWLALVPLSVALWRAGLRRLAGVTAALILGIPLVTMVGGVIIFGALAALAFAPAWFSTDGSTRTAIA